MKRFAKIVKTTIIFTIYNYFRNISLPHYLLHEINMNFLNTGLIFSPDNETVHAVPLTVRDHQFMFLIG